jgi:hypothetical protein
VSVKVYKVTTAQNVTEFVEADAVELDLPMNRVVFYLDSAPVASYAGYMGFSPYNPDLVVEGETP